MKIVLVLLAEASASGAIDRAALGRYRTMFDIIYANTPVVNAAGGLHDGCVERTLQSYELRS